MPTAGDSNHWQSDERHLCVGKWGLTAAKRGGETGRLHEGVGIRVRLPPGSTLNSCW